MTRFVLIVFIHVLCCCSIALSESTQCLSFDGHLPASQIAPIRVDHFGPGTWPISGPNKGGEPYYVLQDPVNFDVLAILDEDGDVVEQYSWEPYGTVLVCETHGSRPPPISKIGHHGLFFDRLDMPSVIGGYMNYPTFEPGAVLLGHVRNRAYLPSLGRWAQRDPNATGQVLGQSSRTTRNSQPSRIDIEKQYADGCNLYEYVKSAPQSHRDPHGLYLGTLPDLVVTTAVSQQVRVGTPLAMTIFLAADIARRVSDAIDTQSRPRQGAIVYRIHGGKSQTYGESWTPQNPKLVNNPRSVFGLPDGNSGETLATASVDDPTGIEVRAALPMQSKKYNTIWPGGGIEWVIRNSFAKVVLLSNEAIDPPY